MIGAKAKYWLPGAGLIIGAIALVSWAVVYYYWSGSAVLPEAPEDTARRTDQSEPLGDGKPSSGQVPQQPTPVTSTTTTVRPMGPPASESPSTSENPPAATPVPPTERLPGLEEDKPEPLPEYPKLHPHNTLTALNPEKTLFAEVATVDGKKKVVRVGLACEVCLREGPLEVFLCKKGTKEHEAIVRVDADAKFIHAALEAAGAKRGKPTQFINPQTEQAEYKPATGDKIRVVVHYRRGGQLYTHPAQEWIWDRHKKEPLPHDWVFAGSVTIVDPDSGREFYAANSGDIISISNFPYSMLEIPVEISKDDANLTYEARTSRIPPVGSKVWVILAPMEAMPPKGEK
ncbi:MAG: YdjY domain-containing protein [Gemmataceae bacterium]|nr:YdjY domain-containing protein [Gemmataceae bacterium]MDW8242514.1 YdjY domain-containing protein [Thermogemmata sp.]